MRDIRDLLDEVIVSELENLETLETSEEKSTAIDGVVKLYKLKIEESKNDGELMEKVDARENEQLFKKDQFRNEKKHQYIKIGLEAAGIILPLVFYGMWMKRGFEFEKEGTYTSTTFRNLFGKFRASK